MTEKRIPCEKSPNTGVIDIKQKGYKHCSVIHLNVQLIGNCVDQTVICIYRNLTKNCIKWCTRKCSTEKSENYSWYYEYKHSLSQNLFISKIFNALRENAYVGIWLNNNEFNYPYTVSST